jgi:pimeloyl-ACP methyl ester carboxylesterase
MGGQGLISEQWTTIDGWRVFARVASGRAPAGALPVVCVPGLGVSGRYFTPLLTALAPARPVFAPDLPGSGRSDGPNRALTIAELADALAAWMQAVSLGPAALLGNSFGCQVAVACALRHPGRVAALVLTGPTGDPATRSPLGLLARLALDGLRERWPEPLIALQGYWRFGFRRGIATARMMIADDVPAKLPLVTAPALVVRGEHDPIATPQWVDAVAELLPQSELVVIPNAAHAVNYDAPAALAAAVNRFLASGS